MIVDAHVCPSCNCLYRPRHDREAETCWSCLGMTAQEHVDAIREATGQPVIAHRHNARPSPARQANRKPAYLERIEQLLRS